MAKDITIKNPQGTITYYPKTVSQLVYDNETDETVKEQIDAVNKKVRFVDLTQLDTLKTVDSLGKYVVYNNNNTNAKIGSLEVYSEPTATYIIQVLNSNIKEIGNGGWEYDTVNGKNYILTRHYTLSTNTWSEWKNDLEVNVKSEDVSYDSSSNYLTSENVQGAIDELASEFEFGTKDVTIGYKYPKTTSTYSPVADSRYCLSPYIPCKNGDTVVFCGGYEGTALGMPLFGATYNGVYHYNYDAEPKTQVIGRANAAYVRLSFLKDSENAYVEVNGVRVFEWSGRTYKKYNLLTMDDEIGDLSKLNTDAKDSLVEAIDEVNTKTVPMFDKLNYKKVLVPPYIFGYWTNIGAVGDTFVPATHNYGNSTSKTIRRTKVEVEEGDKIYIDNLYMSTQTAPSWVFVDENNVILKKATSSSYTDLVLTAPQGAKMLYIQNNISQVPTVNMWKYIIAKDVEDTDEGWETIPYKPHRGTTGLYVLTKKVGEKFIYTTDGSPYSVWYKVCPKDKVRLTMQVLSGNLYSYYILGRGDIIIAAGEIPSDRMLVDEEFEVPFGGEVIVFSSYPYSSRVRINRKNETNSNIDFISKESVLMSLSENQNTGADGTQNKRLTLAWCSDTHDDGDNYRRFIDYVNGHQGIIDAVIHTGDMNRMSDTDYGFNNTILKYRCNQPFIPVMGNHDSHGAGNAMNHQVLGSGAQDWQANKYVVPFMDDKCVRGENNCYFYRDFDAYKIRIICLLDYDISRYVNITNWATTTDATEIASAVDWENNVTYSANTVINYKGLYLKAKVDSKLVNQGDYYANAMTDVPFAYYNQTGRYIGQEQANFFISALTDTKLTSDWGIIIATHIPFDSYVSGNKIDENWQDRRGNWLVGKYSQNGYILGDIVTAFLDRTTINKTYEAIVATTTPLDKNVTKINNQTRCPDVIVNANFSGTTAHIICTMAGHTHQQGCYRASTVVGHRVVSLVSETSCYAPDSMALPNEKFGRFGVSDIIRGGNAARDCFNIISFDTTNKYIYLMRIGADTNDIMTKRDITRISYADEV